MVCFLSNTKINEQNSMFNTKTEGRHSGEERGLWGWWQTRAGGKAKASKAQ